MAMVLYFVHIGYVAVGRGRVFRSARPRLPRGQVSAGYLGQFSPHGLASCILRCGCLTVLSTTLPP